jgi:hypothetical protein
MGDIGGFLVRGLMWVAAGLAISRALHLSSAGITFLFAGWLAGLAVIGWINARQWPSPVHSVIAEYGALLVMAAALLLALRNFQAP